MIFDKAVFDDLSSGEKSICFFVHEAKCYWVLDYKYNFSLNAEKDYHAYLEKGFITRGQYSLACRGFRGGILRLAADNFLKYLDSVRDGVLAREDFEGIFYVGEGCDIGELLGRVESFYLSGAELCVSELDFVGRLVSRLPNFYVNFDRKIYMHMDVGRLHENLAYPDWFSRCADFNFLIPDAERYWVGYGDYWKFRFV